MATESVSEKLENFDTLKRLSAQGRFNWNLSPRNLQDF